MLIVLIIIVFFVYRTFLIMDEWGDTFDKISHHTYDTENSEGSNENF